MRINGGRAEVRPLSLTIALVLSFALAIAAHGLLPRTASAESGTFRIYFVQTGDIPLRNRRAVSRITRCAD